MPGNEATVCLETRLLCGWERGYCMPGNEATVCLGTRLLYAWERGYCMPGNEATVWLQNQSTTSCTLLQISSVLCVTATDLPTSSERSSTEMMEKS